MEKEPLLSPSASAKRTSSALQALGNIIVSIVGTGVLGLPFAFRVAGWLGGSVGVIVAGILTYYCMILLVDSRDVLVKQESKEVETYGDLGAEAAGKAGRCVTEFLIIIAQCGGAVAYLVFIGQNLVSIFRSQTAVTFSAFVFLLLPLEVALSMIRTLSALAPFSAFADLCNLLAMAIVVKEDLQLFRGFEKVAPVTSAGKLPFAAGMAVFCFEGFGMTLALEGSMRDRRQYKAVLLTAFVGITVVYLGFGFFGYLAYAEETRDIITLNLPDDWSSLAVKIGLCTALAFTFPIMMHPIHEIIEGKLKASHLFQKLCHSSPLAQTLCLNVTRAMAVVVLAVVASFIPAFGTFVAFVGSTVCALLSFVLPATFHLLLIKSAALWQKVLDVCILVIGLAFAVYGTYTTLTSG